MMVIAGAGLLALNVSFHVQFSPPILMLYYHSVLFFFRQMCCTRHAAPEDQASRRVTLRA